MNQTRHQEPSSVLLHFLTPDGLRLEADAWGNNEAPPVLLLHGGGQTRHAWKGTAKRLATAGYYAVSLDLRGHGNSQWSQAEIYNTASFIADITSVAKSFKQKPIFIGASLGGIISLLAQGESSTSLCSAIVLVDIAAKAEESGVSRILAFMQKHQEGFASIEEAGAAVAEYLQHRRRTTAADGLQNNLRLAEDGRYYWHWDPALLHEPNMDELRDEQRLLNAAKALTVPTLLVRGMQSDVLSDESVSQFLRAVPHAEYVNIAGAGHMVAGDTNDVFTEAVLTFISKINPTSKRKCDGSEERD